MTDRSTLLELARMDRPATTSLKCPKCRSRTFQFMETCEWGTSFEVVNGILDRQQGYHEPGMMTRLEAHCVCGHRWKVRGALQITDAVTEFDPAALRALANQPEDNSQ